MSFLVFFYFVRLARPNNRLFFTCCTEPLKTPIYALPTLILSKRSHSLSNYREICSRSFSMKITHISCVHSRPRLCFFVLSRPEIRHNPVMEQG
ncbi:MAG: hypothetical protein J3R72DRAFT_451669 [Linnemannia gamsii]|nr:MAG: hypothetical protein J3R72DRAFT_451669 [Linnemannia gamsii]